MIFEKQAPSDLLTITRQITRYSLYMYLGSDQFSAHWWGKQRQSWQ